MGVMSCSRNDCESIMCDLSSREHGYICYECFQELKDNCLTYEFNVDRFMQSPKPSNDTKKQHLCNYYQELFE